MEDFQDNGIDLGNDVGTPTDSEPSDTQGIDFNSGFNNDFADSTNEAEQQPTEVVQEQPSLRIKYNHEEKELSYDEAVELAQKGMNYEKAIERATQEAEQRALDNFIAQQGYEWNGEPITTFEAYQQALAEQEILERYQDSNLPDEVVDKLLQFEKFQKDYEQKQQQEQQQELERQQFDEFVEAFPDADPQAIPEEVWVKYQEGTPLKYAYMEYEMNNLRQLAKVQQQNQINQSKPTLGVTSFGTGEPEKSVDPFWEGFNS